MEPSDIVEWLEIDSVVAIMIGSALIYSKYTISDFHNEGLRKGIKLREI